MLSDGHCLWERKGSSPTYEAMSAACMHPFPSHPMTTKACILPPHTLFFACGIAQLPINCLKNCGACEALPKLSAGIEEACHGRGANLFERLL